MPKNISGLIPFLLVAFINAMVDLGHKITIQNTLFKVYDDATQVALTAVVNALILLPFILLFTPAGFLSDRFAKPKIMRWSACSAVFITSMITLCYYQGWFQAAFGFTFILAVQSAIYSPAKYGYIREVADNTQLAPANGFLQATTIIAILTGIFVFTIFFELLLTGQSDLTETNVIRQIAPLGWLLIALSLLELWLTTRLPRLPAANPALQYDWQAYRRGYLLRENLKQLRRSTLIWRCILGLSVFWGVSQTMLAVFPAFAKMVLNETNTIVIQGLLACSGIGIIVGSLLAGRLCRQAIRYSLILIGGAGMVIALTAIPSIQNVSGYAIAIIGFGFAGGLFIIPLNALIQKTAPKAKLGTILAGNNWIQNLTMVSFLLVTWIIASYQLSSTLFLQFLPWLTLILLAPILFKLKKNMRS
ncbi:Long-chain-fatty-acid--CoA ligase [Methylophaga frappieri]|uniref:Long-chain-fatty-acid--CoA ligase n=1 Tax=Methylophaga frappieri (strain ATCC BAA-2434 / DSM 25690 / JAM7) TaxID=754477 RepID=I1YIR0_METFJ|nr:MFS transporter [Methylophaga frappieri]AFJ02803.1 Long-chain-fatty-acid--CoA ligase [Methylophaga frappieri]